MGSGCIDFIPVMCMLGNGVTGRAMGVECILVRTGAGMLGSSSGESSTGLGITILGKMIGSFLSFCASLINLDIVAGVFRNWVICGICLN